MSVELSSKLITQNSKLLGLPMIVTIDGPAGAGKSSAARLLAQRLGFEFLDTGATYRTVALAALRGGIDLHDQAALARLLGTLTLDMPPGRVLLNGEDVTTAIRTPEVTAATGPVADSKVVRRHLAALQRSIAAGRDMVCEGRDQGTIVFPDAARKFFLKADPVERARRRQREMAARGQALDLDAVLRAQQERDRRDAARDLAPMVPARDAIILDSTHLDLTQVVDVMESEVRRCLNRLNHSTDSGTSGGSAS
jgi:cytidylate kinase